MALVSLRTIVNAMDGLNTGCRAFLNPRTAELVGDSDTAFASAEEGNVGAHPQYEKLARLREVLFSPDWVELPGPDTAADYEMMETFCLECCADTVQEELLEAIDGGGAFRRFREGIQREGLQGEWDRFRLDEMEKRAAAWLEEQGIPFETGESRLE